MALCTKRAYHASTYIHTYIHKCMYMYTHPCICTPYIYTCIHTHIHTLRGDAAPRDVASSIPEFCGVGGRHASFFPSSSLGPPMAARPPLIPLLPLGSSGSLWAVQASVWRPLRKFVPNQWK